MSVTYRKATREDLDALWDASIRDNPNDERYVRWKRQFIEDNESGRAATFAIVIDGIPVGEGTLLFSPACRAVRGRTVLADGQRVTNVNALRIAKPYEGQGHIHALLTCMESYARSHGFSHITIGVEEGEARTRAIYTHLGFTEPILREREDGTLVLYYQKPL